MYLSISCTYQFEDPSCSTPFTPVLHSYNHVDFHQPVFRISIIITIAVCIAICYGLVLVSITCAAGVHSSTVQLLCAFVFISHHVGGILLQTRCVVVWRGKVFSAQ
jgi:hypothetical protein